MLKKYQSQLDANDAYNGNVLTQSSGVSYIPDSTQPLTTNSDIESTVQMMYSEPNQTTSIKIIQTSTAKRLNTSTSSI